MRDNPMTAKWRCWFLFTAPQGFITKCKAGRSGLATRLQVLFSENQIKVVKIGKTGYLTVDHNHRVIFHPSKDT
jgi:hypothetical protein